jgi:hypothetical protein
LYARFCTGFAFIPFPFSLMNNPFQVENWEYEWLAGGIYQPLGAEFGLYENPKIDGLKKAEYWWSGFWGEFGELLAWPGLFLTILILFWLKYFRKSEARLFLLPLIAFVVIRQMALILLGIGNIYRYGLPIHILTLSIAATIILNRKELRKKQVTP